MRFWHTSPRLLLDSHHHIDDKGNDNDDGYNNENNYIPQCHFGHFVLCHDNRILIVFQLTYAKPANTFLSEDKIL